MNPSFEFIVSATADALPIRFEDVVTVWQGRPHDCPFCQCEPVEEKSSSAKFEGYYDGDALGGC